MGTNCCRPISHTPINSVHRARSQVLISEMSQIEATSRITSQSSILTMTCSKLIYKAEVLEAASRRDLKTVQQFLNLGFPVNLDLNNSGWSLLHVAAHNGDLQMLEFLVKQGAHLNPRDFEEHWTPVMAAAMNDHPLAVRFLEISGADMSLKDCHGRTVADLATAYKCEKVRSLWSECSVA